MWKLEADIASFIKRQSYMNEKVLLVKLPWFWKGVSNMLSLTNVPREK